MALIKLNFYISVVDCGHPGNIVNGNIQVAGTTYGKTVSYTCNQYYNLTDGDSVQTCQDNFAWSGSKPSCVCKFLQHYWETLSPHA